MGKSCVGPVEGAEQGLIAEHHILPTGLHAQALEPGKVPDQHVGSSDPQCAAVAPAIRRRTPVMVPRIVLKTPGTISAVSAPGSRILEFHVEIQVRRKVVAETQPHQLLDVEVVRLTWDAVRSCAGVGVVTSPVATPAELTAMALPKQTPFRMTGRTRRSPRTQNLLRSKFLPIFGS